MSTGHSLTRLKGSMFTGHSLTGLKGSVFSFHSWPASRCLSDSRAKPSRETFDASDCWSERMKTALFFTDGHILSLAAESCVAVRGGCLVFKVRVCNTICNTDTEDPVKTKEQQLPVFCGAEWLRKGREKCQMIMRWTWICPDTGIRKETSS